MTLKPTIIAICVALLASTASALVFDPDMPFNPSKTSCMISADASIITIGRGKSRKLNMSRFPLKYAYVLQKCPGMTHSCCPPDFYTALAHRNNRSAQNEEAYTYILEFVKILQKHARAIGKKIKDYKAGVLAAANGQPPKFDLLDSSEESMKAIAWNAPTLMHKLQIFKGLVLKIKNSTAKEPNFACTQCDGRFADLHRKLESENKHGKLDFNWTFTLDSAKQTLSVLEAEAQAYKLAIELIRTLQLHNLIKNEASEPKAFSNADKYKAAVQFAEEIENCKGDMDMGYITKGLCQAPLQKALEMGVSGGSEYGVEEIQELIEGMGSSMYAFSRYATNMTTVGNDAKENRRRKIAIIAERAAKLIANFDDAGQAKKISPIDTNTVINTPLKDPKIEQFDIRDPVVLSPEQTKSSELMAIVFEPADTEYLTDYVEDMQRYPLTQEEFDLAARIKDEHAAPVEIPANSKAELDNGAKVSFNVAETDDKTKPNQKPNETKLLDGQTQPASTIKTDKSNEDKVLNRQTKPASANISQKGPKDKSARSKIIKIAVAAIVVLAIAGAAAFFYFRA